MRHRISPTLNEKQRKVLQMRDRIISKVNIWKQWVLCEVGGNRRHPKYLRVLDSYFRAISRIQKLCLTYNISAIETNIWQIGNVGTLRTLNWNEEDVVLFTEDDKAELTTNKSIVLSGFFELLNQMPSCTILKENHKTSPQGKKYKTLEHCSLQYSKDLASLSTWIELGSAACVYSDSKSVIYDRLVWDYRTMRRSPKPNDSIKIYSMRLQLFSDFRQSLVGAYPLPFCTFYIFQFVDIK